MNRRFLFFVSGLLGAALVTGGVLSGLRPFDQAQASPESRSATPDSFIEEALADFAPGAAVKRTDEGVVIVNARFSPAEQARHDRAYAALKQGPTSITCSPYGVALQCSSIADDHVVAALKQGTAVYGRTAITGVTSGGHVPKVEADALTCGAQVSDGTLPCWPVTKVAPPTLPASDVVIYYDHFDVTFEGDTMIPLAGPGLTIPVAVS